jgi:hypothetical protein
MEAAYSHQRIRTVNVLHNVIYNIFYVCSIYIYIYIYIFGGRCVTASVFATKDFFPR